MFQGKNNQDVDAEKEIFSPERLEEIYLRQNGSGDDIGPEKPEKAEKPVKAAPAEVDPEDVETTDEDEDDEEEEDEQEEDGAEKAEKATDEPVKVEAEADEPEFEDLTPEQMATATKAFDDEVNGEYETLAKQYAPELKKVVNDIAKVEGVINNLRYEVDPDDPAKKVKRESLTVEQTERLMQARDLMRDLKADQEDIISEFNDKRLEKHAAAYVKHNCNTYKSLKPYESIYLELAKRGEIIHDMPKMLAVLKVEHARRNPGSKATKPPTKTQVEDKALEKHIARASLGKVGAGSGRTSTENGGGKPGAASGKKAAPTFSKMELLQRETMRKHLKGELIS